MAYFCGVRSHGWHDDMTCMTLQKSTKYYRSNLSSRTRKILVVFRSDGFLDSVQHFVTLLAACYTY